MSGMTLDEETARVYLGALLAVCRADGDVTAQEMGALRKIATRLGVELEMEALFFDHISPAELAVALGPESPFRGAGGDAAALAKSFVEDARAAASGEDELAPTENAAIKRFAAALGVSA
jgi:tellurite resistance protein